MGDADIEAVAATPADDVGIEALLAAEHHRLGRAALSDHPRLARGHGVPRHEFVTRSAGGAVSGFAIAVAANDTSIVETASPDPTARRALLRAVVEHVPGPLQWWAHHATDTDRALAADLGGRPNRILLQMRRPLPADEPRRDPGLRWTTMAPGDESALITVNNRAFADHDEQGGWTAETFAERGSEPWFDPAGIVEVFADDRLAGFCWTKIHPPQGDDPELGEIYVVGVDPDFQGRGLGAALTLAGLASMAERGVGVGMLYVDADNTAAVAMYDRLGFVTVRQDQSFVWGS